MTTINTSHVTASIAGTLPLVELEVTTARITLDETRAPYVDVVLQVVTPDPATMALLDPRGSNTRILVTYEDEQLAPTPGVQTRTFDLLLHEYDMPADLEQLLSLTLVSDEAKLIDTGASPIAHNAELVTAGASLRGVVNRVLAEYGTALQAGAADADYTPRFDASNDCINPGLEINATGWSITTGGTGARSTVSPAYGVGCYAATATGTGTMGIFAGARMTGERPPNRRISIYFRTNGAAREVTLYARILNAAGTLHENLVIAQKMSSSVWQQLGGTFFAHSLAVGFSYQLYIVVSTNATNQVHYFDELFDGPEYVVPGTLSGLPGVGDDVLLPLTPFGGIYGEPAGYNYAWEGTANASRYLRTRQIPRDPSALQRELGQTDWDHLNTFVRAAGLRLYADEQRKWRLVEDPQTIAGTIEIKDDRLIDGRDTISLRNDYYDVVVLRYTWQQQSYLETGAAIVQELSVVDVADAGLGGTNLLYLEYSSPYPGPGGAAALLERSLARGREQTVVGLTDIDTTPGMAVETLLPTSGEHAGYIAAVTFAWSTDGGTSDRMTVRPRGLVDA